MRLTQKETFIRISASVALLGVGALLFFVQDNSFVIRAFGIVLIIVASFVARSKPSPASSLQGSSVLTYRERQVRNFKKTWPIGIVIISAFGASFYSLHIDAISGGNEIFPVIAFTVMGLIGMGYIAYLGTAQ